MNKARRKWLDEIIMKLEAIQGEVESVQEEEQEAFDSLPESLQYGRKGEVMEEAISEMESAAYSIMDAIESLGGAQSWLEE